MTVEIIDGIRVMKLRDVAVPGQVGAQDMAMLHIWRLLSGGHDMRDMTACDRQFS